MNREVFSRTDETIDEWETPLYLFNLLNNYMIDHGYDTFTLDAAASHENHLCEKYYTKEIDGLKQDWKGETVFVNPPYSNINEWVKKCYKEGQKHNTFVALLIPSRTDTKYWHEYCMKAERILFCKGRVNFLIKCVKCNISVSKTIKCKISMSKTINYEGKRLCKKCYNEITKDTKKIGNGSTFPSVIIIFKKNYAQKHPSMRSFYHKEKDLIKYHTLTEFLGG